MNERKEMCEDPVGDPSIQTDRDHENNRKHGCRYPLFASRPRDAAQLKPNSAHKFARTLSLDRTLNRRFIHQYLWKLWQGGQDSNLQPTVLETATLPIELPPYGLIWFRDAGDGSGRTGSISLTQAVPSFSVYFFACCNCGVCTPCTPSQPLRDSLFLPCAHTK